MSSPLRDGGGGCGGGTPADPSLSCPAVPLRLCHRHPHLPFHSTLSDHKIHRFYALTHLLRFAAFCFSLAVIIFNASNAFASWLSFEAFRLYFIAKSVIGLYSLLKLCASIYMDLRGTTLPPELDQLWSITHDQMLGSLALSAGVMGAVTAKGLGRCSAGDPDPSIDMQATISVMLGLDGFGFLAHSAIVSVFHVASFVLTGSRFRSPSFRSISFLGIDDSRKWQMLASLALSAGVMGAVTAKGLGRCSAGDPDPSIDMQTSISVTLGLAGFGFLALSAVVSGFRVASFVLTGSCFPPPVSRASAVDAYRCES